MVDDAIPYCRPCEALHEEATCYVACKILEKGLPETSDSGECSREPEYINEVSQVHSIDEESWKQSNEYSQ